MQPISVISSSLEGDPKIVVSGFPGLVVRQDGNLDLCEDTLENEMRRLVRHNVTLLVGLIEDTELGCIDYEDVTDAAERSLIRTTRFPLRDFTAPAPTQEGDWRELLSEAARILRQGKSMAVHCMAGDGRSGLLAACLLVDLGLPANEALRQLRAARPQAIETTVQLDYLLARGHN